MTIISISIKLKTKQLYFNHTKALVFRQYFRVLANFGKPLYIHLVDDNLTNPPQISHHAPKLLSILLSY